MCAIAVILGGLTDSFGRSFIEFLMEGVACCLIGIVLLHNARGQRKLRDSAAGAAEGYDGSV
jgi:hypothetical protein